MDVTLKYQPTERQQVAHRAFQRFKLFGGAMGGGKSYWLCMEIMMLMMEYPGNRALMARYHLTDFKNTTLKTLLGLVPEELIEFHNKTEHTVKFMNGSEILYMGLSEESDVNKLKSMEVGVFGFDEASEIPQEQFLLASSRLRHTLPDGTRPKFYGLLTSNPEDCWLKDRFLGKSIDGDRYVFIPSLPRDNPFLAEDYEDNLRKDFPEDWVRRYLEGSWDDLSLGNFVIPRDLIELAIDRELPLKNRYCMGIDVSRGRGGDETVMYVGDDMSVVDYFYTISEKLDETTLRAQKLITQYGIEATCIDDIGIGAGVTDFLDGHFAQGGVEGVNVSRRSTDDRFFNSRAQIWWYTRKMFEDGKVSIPNDEKLVRQLGGVKYKIRNSGKIMLELKEETKKRLGQSPDRGDALILMIWAARNLTGRAGDYNRDDFEVINIGSRNPYGWDAFYGGNDGRN